MMGRREQEVDGRAAFIWAHLLVNDHDGDAYEGVCEVWNDQVMILGRSVDVPLRFHSPTSDRGPVSIDDPRLVIPSDKVKFATVRASGVPG